MDHLLKSLSFMILNSTRLGLLQVLISFLLLSQDYIQGMGNMILSP